MKIFIKPSNYRNYLHKYSEHPKRLTRGVINGIYFDKKKEIKAEVK